MRRDLSAADLEEEAQVLCVSAGSAAQHPEVAAAVEVGQPGGEDNVEEANEEEQTVSANNTSSDAATAGEHLRGKNLEHYWAWLRNEKPTGKGAAARKKAVEKLLSFLDSLE